MNATIDTIIGELARDRHGVVSRRELRRRGVGADGVRRRIRSGSLVELSPRVLRVGGAPMTDLATVMAGVLDAGDGAVASHATSLWFWGSPGFDARPVEVTARRGEVSGHDIDLARVHLPRRLLDRHRVVVGGLPVTTPTRAVFDLASLPGVHPRRVERVLDTLWAAGRISRASLSAMLDDLGGRGRRGIALMRELLDERREGYRPPESSAEARFQWLAGECGLGDFERQVDVGDEDGWIGRVDFLDRTRRIVVEVDPMLHHGSLSDRRNDAARHAALTAAGFRVVSVTDSDLFHRPDHVRGRLRDAARSGRSAELVTQWAASGVEE